MRFGGLSETSKNKRVREEAQSQIPSGIGDVVDDGDVSRGSKLYAKIFEIQNRVEKKGAMDYRAYAREFWHEATGEQADESNAAFKTFEGSLITRFHDIPMSDLVYPDVLESIPKLIERYKGSVAHVSIWSTGDVEATRYQMAKVLSSGVVQKFRDELIKNAGTAEGRRMFQQDTGLEVAGNKFENITRYVRLHAQDRPLKIVIIEDQFKNFEKAEEAIGVPVIPIWAIYSREGLAAREKEALSADEFRQVHAAQHPIEAFAELLDEKRFGEILKDAHVFVDFDGVIGDNVHMRDAQAKATLSAAIDGLSQHWKLDREATKTRIVEKLGPLA